jgi:TonB family protein
MKSCPRCGSTYPDAERFCEADGTALVDGGGSRNRATTVMPDDLQGSQAAQPIVCPECHGKAEPGETICNFCGTQLQPATTASPGANQSPSVGPWRSSSSQSPATPSRTAASPENFVPSRSRITTSEMGEEPPYDEAPVEEQSFGERALRVIGYSLAALVAIAAGAWFALHLSGGRPIPPVAVTSPAVTSPIVVLARNMQINVKGLDPATAPHRDADSARAVFDTNRDAVLDTYKQALERDNTLRDGMVVRLHVLPDGSVDGGSVVVSTSPNPSLDAEVVKTMSDWKFAASSGGPVDVDYPMIFAASTGDIGSLEADLSTKFASLGPHETPEYASAPSVAPTPPVAVATPPEAAPTPPGLAALPPPEARPTSPLAPPSMSAISPPRHHHMRRPEASRPARIPPPSVTDRVVQALSADKRLRRVQPYATGGMVTLTGKVFDDDAKAIAERTVRNVSGVTGVIDNLRTDTSVWAQNETLINQRFQAEGLTGVTAKVIGDGAYLDGTVKTDQDRDRAATLAVMAAPVKVRTNLIRVDPGFFGF